MERFLHLDEIASAGTYADRFSRMGDNYLFMRLRSNSERITTLHAPMRFECMTIIMCRQGSFNAEINLLSHHIEANTLLVVNPGALIKISDIDYSNIDAYMLFVSAKFLVDINIDINAINIRSIVEKRTPIISLSDGEMTRLSLFFESLYLNARDDDESVFSVNIARSICAAIFYQMLQFNFQRISRNVEKDESGKFSRRMSYVHDFMRLVHLNYTRQRSLSFYAEKLFISPKYLTVLVKEQTGRSATEWINEFVIIEAKNLLRYSGKNVQQVAYALNFPNQSSFGKYFKHLTGKSPTAYQKS